MYDSEDDDDNNELVDSPAVADLFRASSFAGLQN